MSFMRVLCGVLVMVFLTSESWARREQFVDPLDSPAVQSDFAARANLVGVARAGGRLVAVGQAGQIVFSDNAGATWQQARVPVSTDLVAVYFPSPQQGWAVGHDGVVLHSADAGASWTRQLTGRQLIDVSKTYYQAQLASGHADAAAQLQNVEQLAASAPAFSFLDVWFRSDQEGYAVGAFNLIFKTTDGGVTWLPWFERTDNPGSSHLYSIRGDATGVYIAGELGLLLRLDKGGEHFSALESPYHGSFFGLMVQGDRVLAYGLRGNAFASANGGKSWTALSNPSDDSLMSGLWLSNGEAVLLSQSGELLRSTDTGLEKLGTGRGFPANAAVATEQGDAVAVVGPMGVRQLKLN